MPAFVTIGPLQIGSASNQVGLFSGQNMQNAWDSHSPNVSTMGVMMGQSCTQWTGFAPFYNWMLMGQPLLDSDVKVNYAPLIQGP